MELGGASLDSTGFGAMDESLISSGGRNLMFPLLGFLSLVLTRIAVSLQSWYRKSGLVLCGGMEHVKSKFNRQSISININLLVYFLMVDDILI